MHVRALADRYVYSRLRLLSGYGKPFFLYPNLYISNLYVVFGWSHVFTLRMCLRDVSGGIGARKLPEISIVSKHRESTRNLPNFVMARYIGVRAHICHFPESERTCV